MKNIFISTFIERFILSDRDMESYESIIEIIWNLTYTFGSNRLNKWGNKCNGVYRRSHYIKYDNILYGNCILYEMINIWFVYRLNLSLFKFCFITSNFNFFS